MQTPRSWPGEGRERVGQYTYLCPIIINSKYFRVFVFLVFSSGLYYCYISRGRLLLFFFVRVDGCPKQIEGEGHVSVGGNGVGGGAASDMN